MPETPTIEDPVLIVGAGPTGLLTANLLGTYGVACLVIERNQVDGQEVTHFKITNKAVQCL